mmetsp:Transcript_76372/g.223987  ORF Transcript_76372/g.223987 Transcript_76372/m.223987 type:complete len:211 (-) Transcript_76372:918-1550(-)
MACRSSCTKYRGGSRMRSWASSSIGAYTPCPPSRQRSIRLSRGRSRTRLTLRRTILTRSGTFTLLSSLEVPLLRCTGSAMARPPPSSPTSITSCPSSTAGRGGGTLRSGPTPSRRRAPSTPCSRPSTTTPSACGPRKRQIQTEDRSTSMPCETSSVSSPTLSVTKAWRWVSTTVAALTGPSSSAKGTRPRRTCPAPLMMIIDIRTSRWHI